MKFYAHRFNSGAMFLAVQIGSVSFGYKITNDYGHHIFSDSDHQPSRYQCTEGLTNAETKHYTNVLVNPDNRVTDPKQIKWLFNQGFDITFDMIGVVINNFSYRIRGRIRDVRDSMVRRLRRDDYHDNAWFEYKGTTHSANNVNSLHKYNKRRKFFTELTGEMRTAIKERDADNLEHFMSEHMYEFEDDFRYTYQRISDALTKFDLEHPLVTCDCDHVELRNETHGVERYGNTTVCNSCYEENYVTVEDADWEYHRDECYYCEEDNCYYRDQSNAPDYDSDVDGDDDDYSSRDPSRLMDYSTDVTRILEPDRNIVSSTHGDFLMGIEFEMGQGEFHSRNDAVTDVLDKLSNDYCVCKLDGSVGNGFEIVTAPRGLAEHISKFKAWEVKSHYRAWDMGCCGMHIHIHSKAFTPLTLGKFIMLINSESNVDFIRKIAGRHPMRDSQAREYCAAEHQDILTNPNHAIKNKATSRYRMVNTENLSHEERERLQVRTNRNQKDYDTIELRIFRASLKKERLLAQIEFTHAAVMFCRVASWRDLDKKSFIEWLRTTNNNYPHLSDWYGIRRRAKKQEQLTGMAPSHVATESTCADSI